MPETQAYNSTFQLLTFNKVQIGKWILLMYPDPSFGGGGGNAWSWEVYDVAGAAIVNSGAETYGPGAGTFFNYRELQLLSANYTAGKLYRVRIFDSTLALVDEWYFIAYSNNFGGIGPVNVALINEYIARIAGLLGHNQVITHDEHDKGVPTKTTIDCYDDDPNLPASSVIYTYEQRKFLDPQYRVSGEISTKIL